MRIRISIPNDYASEQDAAEAVADLRKRGLIGEEASAREIEEAALEALASVARRAGLEFVAPTDFGAEWEGPEDSVAGALRELPAWAYRDTEIVR